MMLASSRALGLVFQKLHAHNVFCSSGRRPGAHVDFRLLLDAFGVRRPLGENAVRAPRVDSDLRQAHAHARGVIQAWP